MLPDQAATAIHHGVNRQRPSVRRRRQRVMRACPVNRTVLRVRYDLAGAR